MRPQNSVPWDLPGSVDFFKDNRKKTDQLYKSEWFFLQNLFKEGMSILDIGCAWGGFANICQEHLKNFEYTGIDISKNMIEKAKMNHPNHSFYHIEEANLSPVQDKKFDLVLCLGILHLSFKWRELIKAAWNLTGKYFMFDLRETPNQTIENIQQSSFKMNFNSTDKLHESTLLPYIILNSADALNFLLSNISNYQLLSHYGYVWPVSNSAITPVKNVMMNTYCIEKKL